MTELQFLIDLLLNHKLPPATKKIVAARIGEVEVGYQRPPLSNAHGTIVYPAASAQAPSTQRILDQMAAEAPQEVPAPSTPAAAAALQARADAIRNATQSHPLRGKPEPGRTSPRKF